MSRAIVLLCLLAVVAATAAGRPSSAPAPAPAPVPVSTRSLGGCGLFWLFSCDDKDDGASPTPPPVSCPACPTCPTCPACPDVSSTATATATADATATSSAAGPATNTSSTSTSASVTLVDVTCACSHGCTTRVTYTLAETVCPRVYCTNGASFPGEDCEAVYTLNCDASTTFVIGAGQSFYVNRREYRPDGTRYALRVTC